MQPFFPENWPVISPGTLRQLPLFLLKPRFLLKQRSDVPRLLRLLCLAMLLAIFCKVSLAQLVQVNGISTVAGNGTGGFAGDGGAATSAVLAQPHCLALDSEGNLYVSDSANNRVRKISASTGLITTVAGNGAAGFSGDGGPAISAELSSPYGLAFDKAGNLYIADSFNNRIRMVAASSGNIMTVAGTGTH